jgi:hypothetical protein
MHVLTAEGSWIPMVDTPYDSEDYLQRLLATHPELMPGELFDSENPRQWLLLTREAGIALAGDTGGAAARCPKTCRRRLTYQSRGTSVPGAPFA